MQVLPALLTGASWIFLVPFARVLCTQTTTSSSTSTSETTMTDSAPFYESGSSSVCYVTTPDAVSAKKIAHALVSQKLAACVNIIPQITSIYDWEGKINEDSEVLMMIKTRTSRVEELTKFVRQNHPYSVAEVISLPIENGNPPYLDWISKTVPDKN